MRFQTADCRIQIGWRVALLAAALLVGGCAAGSAFRQGNALVKAGNLDEAVAAYRKAAQADPDNTNYKIALERTQLAASRAHLERAKDYESKDQLEAALGEYRQASEFDPTNRLATAKVAELDRTIRQRVEASRPRPPIEQMRAAARAASAPPLLNPASREPLRLISNNSSLRDILNTIGQMTGINVTFDRDVQDRSISVALDQVTLEQALNQIMTMNTLSYKVINDKTIFVFQDTNVKHAQYDDQVIRTFYLSHADATEVAQTVTSVVRLPGIAIQPIVVANKTANSLTVRGTTGMVEILEKIIQQNDKPRAELVIDVEILEVDRSRAKTYGLNLTEYAIGAVFSPEQAPSFVATPGTGTGGTPTTSTGTSTTPGAVRSPAPFNLNTISRGVSTSDFYLAVPAAIVRFLESDIRNKVIAKPQMRGAEGTKWTMKIGDKIPVIQTSYTPIATGGAGVNPLSSYNYQDVGVTLDMTPTVTLEGDIRLDLTVISSTRKNDVIIAGVNIPSFGNREVTTRMRLRDGESHLLAGLLQENERKSLTGFPGAIHVPVLRELFSSNDSQIDQTDIVMLLTPHIVRTHEITEDDLKPIYIGSQQNLGLNGPPPLIAAQPAEPPVPVAPAPAPAPAAPQFAPGAAQPGAMPPTSTTPAGTNAPPGPQRGPGGTVVAPPPGSTPVPGTVLVQPQPPAPPPIATANPATPETATPPPVPPEPTTPPPAPTTPPAAQQTAPATPTTSAGIGSAQVAISAGGTAFRVGGGPYTVPITVTEASRLSTVTLTIIFDPTKLRVRSVTEGSFMRTGGASVAFTNQVNNNRIDITLVRSSDATGASGTGVLAAILFDAIAPGSATLSMSGTGTGPGGAAMGLRFTPVTVTIQ